jgi:hypothetical protein
MIFDQDRIFTRQRIKLRLFGAGAGDCRRLCGPILTPSPSFHGAAKRIPWNLGTPCKPIPPHRIPTQAPPNPLCTSATCVENSKENPVNHENPVHPVKSPSSSCLSPKTSQSAQMYSSSDLAHLCSSVFICVYLWLISYSNPPRPPRLRGEISSVFQVQNMHVAWLYL